MITDRQRQDLHDRIGADLKRAELAGQIIKQYEIAEIHRQDLIEKRALQPVAVNRLDLARCQAEGITRLLGHDLIEA